MKKSAEKTPWDMENELNERERIKDRIVKFTAAGLLVTMGASYFAYTDAKLNKVDAATLPIDTPEAIVTYYESSDYDLQSNIICKKVETTIADPISVKNDNGETVNIAPAGFFLGENGKCYREKVVYAPAVEMFAEDGSFYYGAPEGFIIDKVKITDNLVADRVICSREIVDVAAPAAIGHSDGTYTYFAPEGYTLEGEVAVKKTKVYAEPVEVVDENGTQYFVAPEGYTIDKVLGRQRTLN